MKKKYDSPEIEIINLEEDIFTDAAVGSNGEIRKALGFIDDTDD